MEHQIKNLQKWEQNIGNGIVTKSIQPKQVKRTRMREKHMNTLPNKDKQEETEICSSNHLAPESTAVISALFTPRTFGACSCLLFFATFHVQNKEWICLHVQSHEKSELFFVSQNVITEKATWQVSQPVGSLVRKTFVCSSSQGKTH